MSLPFKHQSAQVRALSALPGGGVPATYLNSQQTAAEKKAVFNELTQAFPSCKLLYVTPEQFVKSTALAEVLSKLDRRGLLACFVVDEVRHASAYVDPSVRKGVCNHNLLTAEIMARIAVVQALKVSNREICSE